MTETIVRPVQRPRYTRAPAGTKTTGDVKLIGLVSAAHLLSHFYQLVLPPIFPLLTKVFGVGYAELGLVASLMYVASGLMQTPGRHPGRPARPEPGPDRRARDVLRRDAAVPGSCPGSGGWRRWRSLAGIGNAVFHPGRLRDHDGAGRSAAAGPGLRRARRRRQSRMGCRAGQRARADRGCSAGARHWRSSAVSGWRFTIYLLSQRAILSGETRTEPAARGARADAAAGAGLRVLLAPSVLLCFAYFTLLSVAQVGLQTFFPSAAVAAFGVSIGAANAMLTGFLVAAALGVAGRRHCRRPVSRGMNWWSGSGWRSRPG